MSVLVGELLQDAYLFAGIGDQYNPLDADSTNLALRFLNDLADSYSADALKIFHIRIENILLTVGVRQYLVSGELTRIDSIAIRAGTPVGGDVVGIDYPVKIIGTKEWALIQNKFASGR